MVGSASGQYFFIPLSAEGGSGPAAAGPWQGDLLCRAPSPRSFLFIGPVPQPPNLQGLHGLRAGNRGDDGAGGVYPSMIFYYHSMIGYVNGVDHESHFAEVAR